MVVNRGVNESNEHFLSLGGGDGDGGGGGGGGDCCWNHDCHEGEETREGVCMERSESREEEDGQD